METERRLGNDELWRHSGLFSREWKNNRTDTQAKASRRASTRRRRSHRRSARRPWRSTERLFTRSTARTSSSTSRTTRRRLAATSPAGSSRIRIETRYVSPRLESPPSCLESRLTIENRARADGDIIARGSVQDQHGRDTRRRTETDQWL